jgi:hypothetical protein
MFGSQGRVQRLFRRRGPGVMAQLLWGGNGELSAIEMETYQYIYGIITNIHVHVLETYINI